MEELDEWDIEYTNRMIVGNSNAGYVVKTKNGLIGNTRHSDELINGKQPVYITSDGKVLNMLCDADSLTVIGFID